METFGAALGERQAVQTAHKVAGAVGWEGQVGGPRGTRVGDEGSARLVDDLVRADAVVAGPVRDAAAAILARLSGAKVDLGLAVFAAEAGRTLASVGRSAGELQRWVIAI